MWHYPGASGVRLPRIVGILAGISLLYGAWLVEPRWIYGVIGLLVLYALLTNVGPATALINQANNGLAAAFVQPGGGGAGKKRH